MRLCQRVIIVPAIRGAAKGSTDEAERIRATFLLCRVKVLPN